MNSWGNHECGRKFLAVSALTDVFTFISDLLYPLSNMSSFLTFFG